MAFRLAIAATAKAELKAIRAYERQRIADQIDKQLTTEPFVESRNRKRLRIEEWVIPFEYVPPLWELRAGSWRVYYDGDVAERVVNVRAVRLKPPHRTTEESLREDGND